MAARLPRDRGLPALAWSRAQVHGDDLRRSLKPIRQWHYCADAGRRIPVLGQWSGVVLLLGIVRGEIPTDVAYACRCRVSGWLRSPSWPTGAPMIQPMHHDETGAGLNRGVRSLAARIHGDASALARIPLHTRATFSTDTGLHSRAAATARIWRCGRRSDRRHQAVLLVLIRSASFCRGGGGADRRHCCNYGLPAERRWLFWQRGTRCGCTTAART